jgi:hypothetical protein
MADVIQMKRCLMNITSVNLQNGHVSNISVSGQLQNILWISGCIMIKIHVLPQVKFVPLHYIHGWTYICDDGLLEGQENELTNIFEQAKIFRNQWIEIPQ